MEHITWKELYERCRRIVKPVKDGSSRYADGNFFVSLKGRVILMQYGGETVFESDGKQIITYRQAKTWMSKFLSIPQ